MYLGGFFIEQRCRKPPFCGRFRIPEKVRFRSAALSKNGRNVEITAFLLFLFQKAWNKATAIPLALDGGLR